MSAMRMLEDFTRFNDSGRHGWESLSKSSTTILDVTQTSEIRRHKKAPAKMWRQRKRTYRGSFAAEITREARRLRVKRKNAVNFQ